MTVAREAQFTISLRRRDVATLSKWRYVVTCERCGEDLSDNYAAAHAPSVIKIEGIDRMVQHQPIRARQVQLSILSRWEHAQATGTPFILDMQHSVEHPPAGPMLELAIEDHAEKCGK